MTAKKFKALTPDQQIEVIALQVWRQRRKTVRLMKEMEHVDVQTLSHEALGKYLDIWRDIVKESDGYAFVEWACHRYEQQGLDFNKLTPAERKHLVEELRPKWDVTPDPIKAKMLRLSLKHPQLKS